MHIFLTRCGLLRLHRQWRGCRVQGASCCSSRLPAPHACLPRGSICSHQKALYQTLSLTFLLIPGRRCLHVETMLSPELLLSATLGCHSRHAYRCVCSLQQSTEMTSLPVLSSLYGQCSCAWCGAMLSWHVVVSYDASRPAGLEMAREQRVIHLHAREHAPRGLAR